MRDWIAVLLLLTTGCSLSGGRAAPQPPPSEPATLRIHLATDWPVSGFDEMMRDEGAKLKTVEAALFELMKVAEGAAFRQVVRIVK